MSKRNMRKIINDTDVESGFDLTVYEINELVSELKLQSVGELFNIITDAFIYGYALGKRAERKRLNRTANTEKPEM
ncbi:hypothetical protein SAMN04487770_12015 [Butyrivibrio sp. ob235]|uniref:hypothetical protein n=1 Tax=Butyrivibrio sp. ob235 TaxID=1761780 RepID=UPI0008B24FF9|nr:hypothetical protein [Butyrivibrio sp. ob235]SEL89316.1 hypothetical protein SAMN04487770_12015 [Butyrivibrio sp. ob235]